MDMLAYFLGRLAGTGTNGGSEGEIVYSSIEYQRGENNKDVILFTDENGIEHIMNCVYDSEGKITGLTYDSKTVELEYEGNELINIDNIMINLKDAPKKSYADAICEYYGIDNVTYPYIAVAVQDDKKTRIIYSKEPLTLNEDTVYYHYTASKITGLVGETESSVVYGWLKGYINAVSTWTEANWHLVNGTYFANYPIEETDTIKYYPL